jgi:hypothetical protein
VKAPRVGGFERHSQGEARTEAKAVEAGTGQARAPWFRPTATTSSLQDSPCYSETWRTRKGGSGHATRHHMIHGGASPPLMAASGCSEHGSNQATQCPQQEPLSPVRSRALKGALSRARGGRRGAPGGEKRNVISESPLKQSGWRRRPGSKRLWTSTRASSSPQ